MVDLCKVVQDHFALLVATYRPDDVRAMETVLDALASTVGAPGQYGERGGAVQNLFRMLGSSFGREDFFTAALGVFLDRNEELRDAFLSWIQPWSGEQLLSRSWKVSVQVGRPTAAGEAILDMVLANPELELWFEHKVDAGKGIRTTSQGTKIDQIEKYLDAAARYMQGISTGAEPAAWPKAPASGLPRVLLYYVTRDPSAMDREVYTGRLAEQLGFGLAWPPAGHLRWKDLWPHACAALDGALRGERGEFEKTLTRNFLDYWRSLPGMWVQDNLGLAWQQLLEAPQGQSAPFDRYWNGVQEVAIERLGWKRDHGYKGLFVYFTMQHSVLDQIEVSVVTDGAKQEGAQELGGHVLSLLLRAKGGYQWPPCVEKATFEIWRGRLAIHSTGKGKQMRVLVDVPNWSACLNDDERDHAVASAFVAGLRMFVGGTGIEIPELVPATPRREGEET